MNGQKDSTSSFLDILSGIKDQVFHQKQQMICLTEQIIHDKNISCIPQALSYLSVGEYTETSYNFQDYCCRRKITRFQNFLSGTSNFF